MSTVKERMEFINKENMLPSFTKLASRADISTGSILQAISKNHISRNISQKIATTFGLNLDWVMTGNGEPYADINEKNIIRNNIQSKPTIQSLKNPKIINMHLMINKDDTSTNAEVVIDECKEFRGDGFYLVEVMKTPKLYHIKADALGNVTLSTPTTENTMSAQDFTNIKIMGMVKAIFKEFL